VIRRGWKLLLGLLLLVVAADAIFVAANRPDTKTDDAASAAVVAEYGTDPSAGANASCKFSADVDLIVWRAKYDCVVGICKHDLARLRITHVLTSGWSFRVISGGRVADATSGETAPSSAAPAHTDPGNCT
jgi:hypothetical protein